MQKPKISIGVRFRRVCDLLSRHAVIINIIIHRRHTAAALQRPHVHSYTTSFLPPYPATQSQFPCLCHTQPLSHSCHPDVITMFSACNAAGRQRSILPYTSALPASPTVSPSPSPTAAALAGVKVKSHTKRGGSVRAQWAARLVNCFWCWMCDNLMIVDARRRRRRRRPRTHLPPKLSNLKLPNPAQSSLELSTLNLLE